MIAALSGPWLAPALSVAALAAVAAGAALGAIWDRATAAITRARADYRAPATGAHRR